MVGEKYRFADAQHPSGAWGRETLEAQVQAGDRDRSRLFFPDPQRSAAGILHEAERFRRRHGGDDPPDFPFRAVGQAQLADFTVMLDGGDAGRRHQLRSLANRSFL